MSERGRGGVEEVVTSSSSIAFGSSSIALGSSRSMCLVSRTSICLERRTYGGSSDKR